MGFGNYSDSDLNYYDEDSWKFGNDVRIALWGKNVN